MMGESYSRVKEQAELAAARLRAEVVIDMERELSQQQLSNLAWFPKYVQTLSPVGSERKFEEGSHFEHMDVSLHSLEGATSVLIGFLIV